MTKEKRERKLLVLTGIAAVIALSLNLIFTAVNTHNQNKKKQKKDTPGLIVHINLSPSEILKLADCIVAKSKEVHDAVAAIPLDKATYSNAISPLAELEAQQFPLVQSCVLPKMVGIADDVVKASAEAERRIDFHVLACSKREDVYRVVKAFASRGEWTNPEAKRFTQYLVRDFERNGLNLTLSKREELQRLQTKIDHLSMRYIQNLSENDTFLLFTKMELVGLPSKFIESLESVEGNKVKVSLRSLHVSPLLEYCKVGATRKKVAMAYGRRCGDTNLHILENLVQLRHKLARLLGYANFADYVTEPRMAKTSVKVFDFLEDMSAGLTDLATRELAALKELKKKDEDDSTFGTEDLLYYLKRAEEEKFNLDFGTVKHYFPVNLVLSGIFKIFQDLFGLRFEEIVDAEVWHSDVRLFSVLDYSSRELMGYFYLDVYSREGKYGQTCVLSLQTGSLSSKGERQIPVALLLFQFRKEADGSVGFIRFNEVVNLFHELSHAVHHICNRASFARFSGLRVDADFIEIPSQVLENWCYESMALKLISGFHQDIAEPIKDEMCLALKKRRDFFSAIKLKQEILLCLFDQIMHSSENVDSLELLKHLHPKVMLGLPMLEGTNPASSFPRFAIGYEAACYSRIWSEVFAADIFASKFQGDIFNNYVGMLFRKQVLAPGGSTEPLQILSDFLGREPSVQAFLERKAKNSL